ncbi:MAG TPA: pseudouridine synthase [Acidobacteriota bacterium]|nr:pseudouridine synthase [Acidobacteriota bacterium]
MDKEERLQKIIAAAGITSRRAAEELIRQGRVTVNGRVVTELGSKAIAGRDHIKVDGKLIHGVPQKLYILLNKPRKVISTVSDPQGRTRVTDLVAGHPKIYPVGRLDYNTEGLILLTNDGEFARIVSSAGKHLPKVYHVKVRSAPDEAALESLREGIQLRGGSRLARCIIRPLKEGNNSWFEVTLTQGRNRQIREMFQAVGNPVMKLRRTRIGFLSDHGLAPGQSRPLARTEVERILRIGKRVHRAGKKMTGRDVQ